MKNNITNELKKLGIVPTFEDSCSLKFSVEKYQAEYTEEDRECLAFMSNTEKVGLYARLNFTVGDDAKYKYTLKISDGIGPKEIAEWVSRKMKNPERDTTRLEDYKRRIEGLGYSWLDEEKPINISSEFEDYEKMRIDSLIFNYNNIITEDHMLVQIKTLLDQPGQPQLLLLKTIALTDDTMNIQEEEFDENELESIVKRSIMFRYLELEEQATGGDEDKIRERSEKL